MDRTLVIKADATPEAVGIRVSEYAAARGLEPMDAAFQLLADNNLDVVAVYFSISDEDIATVMRNINGMFGSDGIYVPGGKKTHPRIMGTMPRVLGHYVREKGVLRLDEAVRKMTSLPARRMRLARKGLLLEGYDADIVLFDAATVTDTADFIKDSYAPNQGIRHVIVNGRIAMTDNTYTGAASGRVYRAR
jgi:N-acyl-D-aspartate/D-glutamate deacylase